MSHTWHCWWLLPLLPHQRSSNKYQHHTGSYLLVKHLTSSLWVMDRMVWVSSGMGGLPRSWLSWLWLCDGTGGGFPSGLRDWRSPLAVAPALSLRTGFVSHFFKVLTERLEPGELGAELPDACGGSDTTEVEMLPSLPAAEYESRERKRERRRN